MPADRSPRRLPRALLALTLSVAAHVLLLRAAWQAPPPLPAPPAPPPVLTAMLERPPLSAAADPARSADRAAPVPAASPPPAAVARRPVRAPSKAALSEPAQRPAPLAQPSPPAPPPLAAISPPEPVPSMAQAAPQQAEQGSAGVPPSEPAAVPSTDAAAGAGNTAAGAITAEAGSAATVAANAPAITGAATSPPAPASESSPGSLLPTVKMPRSSGGVRYRIHYGDSDENNVVAQVDYLFELQDGAYRLYTEGRASGLMSWFYRGTLVQLSSGTIGAHGLTTQRYLEKRGERAARETSVDSNTGEVVFDAGARAPAPPGLQDKLSVLLQLALLRQAQPERFKTGAAIELPMLATSGIDHTPWQVLGEEAVSTDAGPVPAVRLTRRSADRRDPVVDVWLALDARLFPVRLRAVDANGQVLDQVLANR